MAILTCNITIEGFWRKNVIGHIPNHPGIFFVYEATFNEEEDTIQPRKLIYIGQSGMVQDSISKALTEKQWNEWATEETELCFSTAFLVTERERITSAFIYKFKPPANTEYVDFFTYDKTTIIAIGKTSLLEIPFTV